MPVQYRFKAQSKEVVTGPYRDCTSILEAIFGGRRLELPFQGFLLIGY